jgi:AcrR family transcriptional regulator
MPKILTSSDVTEFRQRLCDLALKAFCEGGVEAISLRALATEARCSRMTPYRYFKNKADILAALREAEFKRMADALELAAQNEVDSSKRLVAFFRCYLDFAMERPDAYRLMHEVKLENEQRYPELTKQIKRSQAPLMTAVNEAVEAGTIHGDPVNIGAVLGAGLHGLISLHLNNKLPQERDIAELADVMARSLSRAIATEPSAQPAASRTSRVASRKTTRK